MYITVIGRDEGNIGYENILIYNLEVTDLEHDTVLAAFIEARTADIGMEDDERDNIEVLFAFPAIDTIADWRG